MCYYISPGMWLPMHYRLSTERDVKVLVRMSLANRWSTAPELRTSWEDSGVHASRSTVSRRLRESELNGRGDRKKPRLTAVQRQRCFQFARDHEDLTWMDWSSVLFSDESRFTLYSNDGSVFVQRRVGEALLDAPTVKFGGGGVIVWGAMSYRGVGFSKRYTGELKSAWIFLVILLFHHLNSLGMAITFGFMMIMHCHSARAVLEWKREHNITSIE